MFNWLIKKSIPVLSPHEGYELWANTYTTESNPIKNYSNKLVEQFLPELNDKSVLDAGCGTGYFCILAKKKGAAKIIGIDFSEAMIEHAKKNSPHAEFHHVDVANSSFETESFDLIVCALVLAHIENIVPVISKLSTYLKKDGELILTDFHPILTAQHSKRTFKDSKTKKTFEIKHYLHPLAEIKNLITNSGLQILQVEEPTWNDTPIIYGLKAKKL